MSDIKIPAVGDSPFLCLCLYQVKLQLFISTLPPALRQEPQFPASRSCSSCSSCSRSVLQCCGVESERLSLNALPAFAVLCPHSAPSKVWAFTSEATCAQSVPDTGCTMAGDVRRVQSLGFLSLPFSFFLYILLFAA